MILIEKVWVILVVLVMSNERWMDNNFKFKAYALGYKIEGGLLL